MAFDVVIRITEDSPRGRVIQLIADERNVTPEEALDQVIDAGIQAHAPHHTTAHGQSSSTPARRLIGLFSSDADAAIMDEVVALVYEGRKKPSTRNIGL